MKTAVTYRIRIVDLLVALALTLIVNFPHLLYSGEMHGRRPPGASSDYIAVQVFYFFLASWVVVSLNTVRRFTFPRKIALSIVVTMLFYLFMPVVNRSGEWNASVFTGRIYNPFHITRWSLVLIVSVLYGKIFDLLYQKQSITLENERLKNENLQTRYNMLANQISPHFLFNSLNSLSMLVRERNNDKALEYIDRLADTFRYMLRSGQEELIALSSELAFTEAYLYLLMVRYENKLFFDMDIDERYRNWKLPVLSLQPLIENAVKHNCITQTRPFRISLRTQDGKLIVSNPSIPKIDAPEKTGIGLKNLSSRYQLLLARDVRIVHTGEEFRVELPLVEP
ncbi:histidine kinase [uncultured Alistipes sp.]|uniref:sensor histidine kinase n=1 Tax=uncultured Alistipes sp. TaxID=538949 RepID=UPI00261F0064|nr:histidine kinase [uncultured Alistipes sp.]